MKFRAGDWVEVDSKEEILRTLDKKGQLEGMPFMPQMFQYCGHRFKVYRRAHKTCDTVNPVRGMHVPDTVHLDLRCDGEAYGGCQAACLIFWKTAWLKPAYDMIRIARQSSRTEHQGNLESENLSPCTEEDVWTGTQKKDTDSVEGPTYICQATQLPYFSSYLPWWDFRQYVEDYKSGNVTLGQVVRGFLYASYSSLVEAGIGLGPPLRWFYDKVQSMWGGLLYPGRSGTIPIGNPTPLLILDLQPGELVRVKSHKKILATLDINSKNRGLMFDGEMMPFCEGTYRVRNRVHKFIDEKTGKLSTLKNAGIILEGASCQARYSCRRMFCPRGIYPWWRETWLERLPETSPGRLESGISESSANQRA